MKRHEFDLFPLLAGVVFLVIAGLYLGDAKGVWHVNNSWVLALALVALGAAGLAGTVVHMVRSSRRPDQHDQHDRHGPGWGS